MARFPTHAVVSVALIAALLSTALAQCSGPECCTIEEVLRHMCTGTCYNIAGEEQPCLAVDGSCTQCMSGLTPPIPPGQNFQMSCTGSTAETPAQEVRCRPMLLARPLYIAIAGRLDPL